MNENFRALRPRNRADKFITREKNNHQFFINAKFGLFGGGGGPGWPINNPTGPSRGYRASESLPNEQLLLNEKLLSCEQIYTNGKKVRAASTSRIFDVHTY